MFRPSTAASRKALADAVTHARRAPFYRTRCPAGVAFSALPLLDKARAAASQDRMHVVPTHRPGPTSAALLAGVVSSATTRTGRPLRMPIDVGDADIIGVDDHVGADDRVDVDDHGQGGVRRDAATSAPKAALQSGPLTLQLYSPRHGVRLPSSPRDVLLPATLHRNTVDVAWDLLTSHDFEAIVAPLSTLKWMTVALELVGVDCRRAAVPVLGATGYPVTAHTRAWLENTWGARVVDNYSLSELPGYAYPSAQTGFQHAVDARVWWELIDPLTESPVRIATGAVGELVATTLGTPTLPLLRYRTGDVVEVGPFEPTWGSRGVRFRGRVSMSVILPGRRRYGALWRDLLEVGEATPDIAFEPHPAELLGLVPPCDIGVPRVAVDNGARRVTVELRYDPARFAAAAAAVADRIAAVVDRAVDVAVVRPGTLDVRHLMRKL